MKNLKEKMNNKGFTLMELIIVVAILAILIALIAPNLVGFLDSASKTSRDANAKSCYTAAQAWATQLRVEGSKVGGSVVIKNNTTDFSGATGIPADDAATTDVNENAVAKQALMDDLNTGAFPQDAEVTIEFTAGKCTKVTYKDGENKPAYYPGSAANK